MAERKQSEPVLFRHYKGEIYRLRGFMLNTHDDSTLVLYSRDADGDEGRLHARPALSFFATVRTEEMNYVQRYLLVQP